MSLLIGILLALLSPAAFAQPAAPASDVDAGPVLVGAVVTQTGAYARLAEGYRKGLLVWLDEVNAAGGLLGRSVSLRLLDDGSDAVRAGRLYAQLIDAEHVDLLIGPFGSAATLLAAGEAERARKVLVNGAGNLAVVHAHESRFVFQTGVPDRAFGSAVIDAIRSAGYGSAYILARDEAVAREQADAARMAALEHGMRAPPVEVYDGATTDFAPQIARAVAAGAEAWIAFGEVRDAADMVRSFKMLRYAPRLFFARAAGDARFVEMVGQDAEYSLAAKAYDAGLATEGNAEFVRAYRAKWSAAPDPAAAEGYVAGTVLAEAVRRAGTLDQNRLRAELAQLEMSTILGHYRADPKTGAQRGAVPSVLQILRGTPRVVWPPALATSALQPYVPWSERRLLTNED